MLKPRISPLWPANRLDTRSTTVAVSMLEILSACRLAEGLGTGIGHIQSLPEVLHDAQESGVDLWTATKSGLDLVAVAQGILSLHVSESMKISVS